MSKLVLGFIVLMAVLAIAGLLDTMANYSEDSLCVFPFVVVGFIGLLLALKVGSNVGRVG